jgi:F-type H+-transporting ATPase subunit b
MEQTLKQLGDLLLGAIPTAVLLVALFALYNSLVHRKLVEILAQRRALTQGAIEQARADVAAAAQRAADYESRLREARLSVFKTLDSRRKQAVDARAGAVAQAREQAQQQIAAAKAQMDSDVAAARASLDASSDAIASQIIQAVLDAASQGPAVAGGR